MQLYTRDTNRNAAGEDRLQYSSGIPLVDISLLSRSRKVDDPINADNWACERTRAFDDKLSITAKMAGAFTLSLLMRWLIDPTPATYAIIPDHIKPTIKQRLIQHPSSIDICVVRPMRDSLIDGMRDYARPITNAGFNVMWTLDIGEAIVYLRSQQNEVGDDRTFISPKFAEHVSDAKNWIFGRNLIKDFLEIATSGHTISTEGKCQ